MSPLLSTGDRVSDTLVIDRLLGEGAFAEVHRVKHEFLGWQAMKLFKRVASLDETRRMLEEARLLSTLGHPNIVRLFDASTVSTPEGMRGFFTMEYVAGGSPKYSRTRTNGPYRWTWWRKSSNRWRTVSPSRTAKRLQSFTATSPWRMCWLATTSRDCGSG